MFASQVLETAVGIAFLLFILATAASALLELGRRLLNSRSKDLEVALQSFFLDKQDAPSTPARFGSALLRMIGFVGGPRLGAGAREAWEGFTSTSVYVGAKAARNQVR